MYFPSELEERFVMRRLLPDARREGVVEELRGWNWHQPPVRPVYEAPLGVYEVAARYCQNGRDIYLRRVQGLRTVPNRGMLDGRALHGLVAGLVVEAKRLIYQHGRACLEPLERLREGAPVEPDAASPEVSARPELDLKLAVVRAFQTRRIVERVERVLAAQPNANADTLVTLALPASVELRLDGSYLGLSRYLAADAVLFAGGAVADLKFGPREPFHRLTTTGYALVLESLYERPVDLGCIVYADVRDGRLLIERDFHIIGDELRQWFLQEREEKARLVAEELDPGLPEQCPRRCTFLNTCHKREDAPREARRSTPTANHPGRADQTVAAAP
jgi:CRISPR-associated protein Csa1